MYDVIAIASIDATGVDDQFGTAANQIVIKINMIGTYHDAVIASD
jgi:hypothetical protein